MEFRTKQLRAKYLETLSIWQEYGDTRQCSWLRHYGTSRKVAGSRPDEVIQFFQFTQSFQPH
jgi:hypothetical protein